MISMSGAAGQRRLSFTFALAGRLALGSIYRQPRNGELHHRLYIRVDSAMAALQPALMAAVSTE